MVWNRSKPICTSFYLVGLALRRPRRIPSTDELKWVGLLFAATEANDFGYLLPIDLVMEDIKEVTGCDVVEPVAV
jgi:hypothetical protein